MDSEDSNPVVARLRALIQPAPILTPAEKLKLAIELSDAGIKMHRQTLRRNFPTLSEAEIGAKMRVWLDASADSELDAADLT